MTNKTFQDTYEEMEEMERMAEEVFQEARRRGFYTEEIITLDDLANTVLKNGLECTLSWSI